MRLSMATNGMSYGSIHHLMTLRSSKPVIIYLTGIGMEQDSAIDRPIATEMRCSLLRYIFHAIAGKLKGKLKVSGTVLAG